MPPLADLQETQPLDDGDDGEGDGADSDSSADTIDDNYDNYNQCMVPLCGETLPIETERVMEDSILYGDTQVVDCDGEEEDVIGDGIETQVVGEDEGDIADEGFEETEIVVNDDGEARVLGDGVDSDASTDDEGDLKGDYVSSDLPLSKGTCKSTNGSVRSIAAIRAAALRASGAAAAESIACKDGSIGLQSSFSGGENFNYQHNAVGQMGADVTVTRPNTTADHTAFDTKATEADRNCEIENSHKCTQDYHRDESKSRTNNPVVKKLFDELTSAQEQITYKPNCSTRHMDSSCSPAPDNIAGLSYIGSQEPGDLSQANALDVVDKFLVVNDLGLSQEFNTGKSTDIVKSPPISGAKGAQQLAKRTDRRSPVGKGGTFEWIDILEDEGGGEFFTKRKEFFFKSKDGTRKSRSQPPKSRKVGLGLSEVANLKYHQKVTSLTCSDSRLTRNSSFVKEKVRVAERRTKKNLFKDLNGHSDSKVSDQQLEVADVDRGEENIYEFGPDTQMAAEAMEALVHGSTPNNETKGTDPALEKSKPPHECMTKRTIASTYVSLRNRNSSIPNLKDVATQSKRRKILPPNLKQKTPICSESNSRGEKSFNCTTEKRTSKRGKSKLNSGGLGSENAFSISFKGEKAKRKVPGIPLNGSNECSSSLTLNVQFSVSKELIQGEFCVTSTPVAHRTRHSKANRLSKKAEAVPNDRVQRTNSTLNVRTRGTIARGDKLVVDIDGSRKTKRKCSDGGSVQSAEVAQKNHTEVQGNMHMHGEETRAGSPVQGVLTHPKRRRTRQTTSDDQTTDDTTVKKDSLLCNDGEDAQLRTRQRTNRATATVKSIAQILDAAKRKRRSVSNRAVSEIDGLTSDSGKAIFTSNVRTRSSLKYSSVKPNVGHVSMNCVSTTVMSTSASTKKASPCSTPSFKQGAVFKCQVKVAEESAKPEESPRGVLHHSKDADVASPVCVAEDHLRTPRNNSRSRSSIARELIRLEASRPSPTSVFSMRRRKEMANVCILFSHHLDDDIIKHQKKIMGRLGVPLASSMSDATHFVTDKFVRTRNMLEAMAFGKPVVTHLWLESCGQTSCFIDEKNYILRDAKKEKEIGFNMPVSLARACQNPLLQGKRVYITPHAKPGREVISSLVKAAHGQPVERIGRSVMKDDKIPDDLLVLSCEEDYSVCIPLLEKGAEIFSSELLLNGIVIQKLEYERHRLFLDHVKRTRSTIWLRGEDGSQFLPVTKCT